MSDRLDLLFRAPRVITAAGEVARCIGVRDGRIAVIEPIDAELDADEVVELGDDEVLIPGLVDTHVHVNEPGRTEWEGFASATRAAAAGGVTTIVDMPLNSIPPTVDVEALAVKRRVALIAGLQHKGQIERGYHADFAVFAPDDAFVVDAAPAPPQSHHPTAEQHGRGRS
jgi:allantoinase